MLKRAMAIAELPEFATQFRKFEQTHRAAARPNEPAKSRRYAGCRLLSGQLSDWLAISASLSLAVAHTASAAEAMARAPAPA